MQSNAFPLVIYQMHESRAQAPRETLEVIEGVVERILYANEQTSFTVAELQGDGFGTVIIQGRLPNVQCGETLRARGRWVTHKTYGRQFSVDGFEVRLPATLHGIRKFLGSGLVPGIGKTYAERIVDRFGVETLRVLDEDSGRLREVSGIGAQRATRIKTAWDEQKSLREVMMFLQTYGIGIRQCMRIVRQYGSEAIGLLKSDPYRLAREIDGIGFKTADQIALNLGLASDGARRIDAGLMYVMQSLEVAGNTAASTDDLLREAEQLLQVSRGAAQERLDKLISDRAFVGPPSNLQLPYAARAEQAIADSIMRIQHANSGLPKIRVDAAVSWAQERAGFAFSAEQARAVETALKQKFTVLTGGPGTGKTSILKAVTDILRAKKARILLASPTGRAAQRLSGSTGMVASTVHRLLKFDPQDGGFLSDESSPLECDMLVVDEASMLDVRLAAALFKAVPSAAHVLLVGDADQLPSVGAGNVLADIIASRKTPVVRLGQVFRQQEGSGIVEVAHAILRGHIGLPPVVNNLSELSRVGDIAFFKADTPEAVISVVTELCAEVLPSMGFDPVSALQVLAPMHRGAVGIQALNNALQKRLNRNASEGSLSSFLVGDKVIQLRNNYDKGIFNGDMGQVTEITDSAVMTANFEGRGIEFTRLEQADLHLAYAISIHKSQGSEFPAVVIPLMKQHYMLLQRNLLYTAITRGRRRVIIVGEPDAWRMAVQRKDAATRNTTLRQRMAGFE